MVTAATVGLFLNKNWEVTRLLSFSAFLFFIQKKKKKAGEEKRMRVEVGKHGLRFCFHSSRLPVFISFSCLCSLAFGVSIKKGKE